jgi:NADPH-dependent F420 reductase
MRAPGQRIDDLTVSVLGGTGALGMGLACRFAAAGVRVVVGSRSPERARAAATTLARSARGAVSGAGNEEAARAGDVVIVAIPWSAHGPLLAALAEALLGKIVVDCVNPLEFDEHGAYPLRVPEGSAAQQAAALLPGSRVVAAFHHVSAAELHDLADRPTTRVIPVLGQDQEATELVQALVDSMPGMRGVYGGRLHCAGRVEARTAELINRYRRHRPGPAVVTSAE